ncbi:SDR family oxidoreductase [Streptomyces cellulosae]
MNRWPELEGRAVLVTGGGRGVGRALSRAFAQAGAEVFVNYFHSKDEAQATVEELCGAGAQAHLVRGSVTKPAHVRQMLDEVRNRAGGLDVLVNNAAFGRLRPTPELTERDWRRTWEVCVQASVDVSLQAAGYFRPGSDGAIVNLSSIGASMVMGNYATVGISKAGVEAATRYLAVELAPKRIRVNCASCGLIESPVSKLFPDHEELRQVVESATPLGRMPSPEQYADLVLFLASGRSSWITGQTVLADGGLSLGAALLAPPAYRHPTPRAQADDSTYREGAADSPEPDALGSAPVDAGEGIAIVGIGAVAPGAKGTDALWELLNSGDPVFRQPGQRWSLDSYYAPDPDAPDKSYTPVLGFATTSTDVSTGEEDYTTVWLREALTEAWQSTTSTPQDKVGLYVGATADGSQHLEESFLAAAVQAHWAKRPDADAPARGLTPHLPHVLAHPEQGLPHVSAWAAAAPVLPVSTETLTVDTACSSSLYAIDVGMRRLRTGACDIAVCGGMFALTPRSTTLFAKLKGYSPTGAVRSFDASADGTLFSDGVGVVVLKTLEKARQDGDDILGVITGMGTSSDGRGKAIYAPNSKGQSMAVQRAYRSGPVPADIQWTVAHGTGTAAGDTVEATTLSTAFGTNDMALTSNKSLIGHTGWAAGVLSVIHVVLALRHGQIPGQRPYPRPPEGMIPSAFTIPQSALPWNGSTNTPRVAAVNSFGFGGTNAHAVISEHHPRHVPHPKKAVDDPVVIVGWHATLPGDPSPEAITAWLSGHTQNPPPPQFSSIPPVPLRMLRLPPAAHQALDPAQRLALLAADGLHDQLGAFWEQHKDTAGVFCGHSGLTAHACHYTLRTALDDLHDRMTAPLDSDPQGVHLSFEAFAAQARESVGPAMEDSYPGGMPNLIPARVAAALDFHGLALGTDTGTASGLDALQLAHDYLSTGTLDFALALAVNGNVLPAWRQVAGAAIGPEERQLAQGAICFALTRKSLAEQAGLPVLGTLSASPAAPEDRTDAPSCLLPDHRSYLGADSALAVLDHLLNGVDGSIHWTDPVTARTSGLAIQTCPEEPASRFRVEYQPTPAVSAARTTEALPPECVILTNAPESVAGLRLPEHTAVLSVTPGSTPGVRHLPRPEPMDVHTALAELGWRPRHVRVIAQARRGPGAPEELLALHDLTFLTIQALFEELAHTSTAIVLYDSVAHHLPVDAAGLFTGLAKSLLCDLPHSDVLCLLTQTPSAQAALSELEIELGLQRATPVVLHRSHGLRLEPRAVPANLPPTTPPLNLKDTSVVVAVGGSRGITAALLKQLARTARPRIWILGSSDIDTAAALPPETDRATFIRQARAASLPMSVAAAGKEYERLSALRDSRNTLHDLAEHCGADRVIYVRCDVRDPAAVDAATTRVLAADQHIDLLLFAAGANRPGETPRKDVADFRRVRDIKARGHANLMKALALHQPGRWVNFGSTAGFAGQPGELDYAAGNEYLAAASAQAQAAGLDHYTIGWPLWSETGLAADPITQRQLASIGLGSITNNDGIRLFERELAEPAHPPYTVLLTDSDLALANSRLPGLCTTSGPSTPDKAPTPGTSPLLGHTRPHNDGTTRFDCRIDTSTDGYLNDHLVDGRPTVPGTFLVEMAVEAACALYPGMTPSKVLNGSFTRFLRTHPRTGTTEFHITADTTHSTAQQKHVAITIATDVRTASGRLIHPDQTHTTCTVVMAEQPHHPAPRLHVAPPTHGAVPDPYYLANGSIILKGAFVTTSHTAVTDNLAYARFAPPPRLGAAPYSAFRTPALLLDGLARTSVLHTRTQEAVSVFALKGFDTITLHKPGSDEHAHTTATGPIHLYSLKEQSPSENGIDTTFHCLALDAAQSPVIEITGLQGYLKGTAHLP